MMNSDIVKPAGRLAGKSVIVTGASSGLGRAIALLFAREGAKIVAADITTNVVEGGPPVIEELAKIGGEAMFIQADVSQAVDVNRVVAETVARHGRLDVLVNNAAYSAFRPLMQTEEEDWDKVMAVNLKGTYLGCRAAVGQMLKQDIVNETRGRIVNFGSQYGLVSAPRNFAYGVSKAGIMYMTKQVATDYAKDHIICNAVAPGKIMTGRPGPTTTPEAIAFATAKTPMPRLGRPSDVANAALFLCSDEASFVTGHTLFVDGGWTAA